MQGLDQFRTHDREEALESGQWRQWCGQCLLAVTQRPVEGVPTPWLLWFYCGFIDTPTWCDHVGQLLVCSGDPRVRPSVTRALKCHTRRSRRGGDLTVVRDWGGPVLDENSPVYVIPPANLLTWWYPHTFKVVPTRVRGVYVLPPKVQSSIERSDRDIFRRVLT